VIAAAPIHAGDDLVGILTIGTASQRDGQSRPRRQARLLASVIDYASVLSVVAGPALADLRQAEDDRERLRRVLKDGALFPVFQPIVAIGSRMAVGFEALTRFADGVPPYVRFSEAREVGLAVDYEFAAVEAAIGAAGGLPDDTFLSLNLSPDVLVSSARRLAQLLAGADRQIVIEVTEHAQIDDYDTFRSTVRGLGNVQLAVDDAGAGYASLRHILELGPTYAKLDISLVRGIDGDPQRQALAAGLAHFAARGGCQLIAEGVERESEATALADLGVELGQGYLFGRPEPLVG
jgi:EAL domain-containing protein (putative c-di-GMP-specific phosphodiesterase class I)